MKTLFVNRMGHSPIWMLRSTVCVLALGLAWVSLPASAVTPWTLLINTNNVVNIMDYGAVGDGVTTNTTAIQSAINAATSGGTTNSLSGGTVEIPAPGTYLCGPLRLANNVNLQIDAGALLRMLPYASYPGGIVNPPNFIAGTNLNDIEISGSGAIDGQGAPWWPGYKTNSRPIMIYLDDCKNELIKNVTLSNSPEFHISIGGSKPGNTTVQGVTVLAPDSATGNPASHNTDACDVSGTNVLVQNCNISTGDDDFACGGGTHDVLITNNTYGNGHGISIGSYTDSGGVSNLTVINCTMNGTENGIRIKSDDGRGGLVQNINYYNISMTNVDFPVQVYSYYNENGTPSSVSPYDAATQAVIAAPTNPPIYRNVIFSNITATSVSGYPIGIIWARKELPATNIVFDKVNITGDESFDLYNVSGAQFIDCNLKVSPGSSTFELFAAQAIITNSAPTTGLSTFDGLTTNGYVNTLALYDAFGSLKDTNVFAEGPLTLADSILTISNNFLLSSGTVLNYVVDSNTNKIAVMGNLNLGGTINLTTNDSGFGPGTNVLLTYSGTLGGTLPTLGTTPGGPYTYTLSTSTAAQVDLVIGLPAPPAPANLTASGTNLLINLSWNTVPGANGYNLKRGTTSGGPYPTVYSGLTATNYADANVTNAVNYYYVVTSVGAGGESTNSLEATAAPLPSNQPTNIVTRFSGGQLQLSWPQDHLGWQLQIQTNNLSQGLGANWVTVPNSANVTATNIVVDPANGAVFLRLVFP